MTHAAKTHRSSPTSADRHPEVPARVLRGSLRSHLSMTRVGLEGAIRAREGEPGGHICVAWQNSRITLFSPALHARWHLGSLPSHRFAALAGNDNLILDRHRD
jgi:hypothetical protein